jgi:hypothetical protein
MPPEGVRQTILKNASSGGIGFLMRNYMLCLVISLPQHISGTLQASSDPDLQVQVFFTANSSPQASQ